MRTLSSHLGRQLRAPCWHTGKARERVRAWLRELQSIDAEAERVCTILETVGGRDAVLSLEYRGDLKRLENRRELVLGNLLVKARQGHLTDQQRAELLTFLR